MPMTLKPIIPNFRIHRITKKTNSNPKAFPNISFLGISIFRNQKVWEGRAPTCVHLKFENIELAELVFVFKNLCFECAELFEGEVEEDPEKVGKLSTKKNVGFHVCRSPRPRKSKCGLRWNFGIRVLSDAENSNVSGCSCVFAKKTRNFSGEWLFSTRFAFF